jgi:hypothetical protein
LFTAANEVSVMQYGTIRFAQNVFTQQENNNPLTCNRILNGGDKRNVYGILYIDDSWLPRRGTEILHF